MEFLIIMVIIFIAISKAALQNTQQDGEAQADRSVPTRPVPPSPQNGRTPHYSSPQQPTVMTEPQWQRSIQNAARRVENTKEEAVS